MSFVQVNTRIFFFLTKARKKILRGDVRLRVSLLNLFGHMFSRHSPSSSCMKQHFHCRPFPLALLFVRRNPGSQALPLLLSFRQCHVVLGSQFFPGCPGLLWLHHDLVLQGLLGHMSCMSTSRFVRHYYKMDKIEKAAKTKKNKKQTAWSFWQFCLSSGDSIQARK